MAELKVKITADDTEANRAIEQLVEKSKKVGKAMARETSGGDSGGRASSGRGGQPSGDDGGSVLANTIRKASSRILGKDITTLLGAGLNLFSPRKNKTSSAPPMKPPAGVTGGESAVTINDNTKISEEKGSTASMDAKNFLSNNQSLIAGAVTGMAIGAAMKTPGILSQVTKGAETGYGFWHHLGDKFLGAFGLADTEIVAKGSNNVHNMRITSPGLVEDIAGRAGMSKKEIENLKNMDDHDTFMAIMESSAKRGTSLEQMYTAQELGFDYNAAAGMRQYAKKGFAKATVGEAYAFPMRDLYESIFDKGLGLFGMSVSEKNNVDYQKLISGALDKIGGLLGGAQ